MAAPPSSESLSNMSLAQAKLARQTKRIQDAEAALLAPNLNERQASRGKGKVWKPFDFNTDATQADTEIDIRAPMAETRVNVFRAHTRDSSISRSMSSMSQRTTGTIASDAERQDSGFVDGSGFQVFTGRKTRRNMEQLSAYEDKPEEKQTTVEATFDPRQIYDVFGNALPAPEFMEQNLGYKDGQLQFIQHPNGDVSAHQWSSSRYIWENIGQFSNIRKKIEGQLAADRLKGETAYQTLQQHTLAYFRTVAKQREASVMGLPFGSKEIQALMPDIRPVQAAPTPKKSVTAVEVPIPPPENMTITHDDTASSTTDSRSHVGPDQPYSYEGYPGYTGYGGYAGQQYQYGYQYQPPTGPRAERQPRLQNPYNHTMQDPFYSASSYRSTYGQPAAFGAQTGAYSGYAQPSGAGEKQPALNYDWHFPAPGADPSQNQPSASTLNEMANAKDMYDARNANQGLADYYVRKNGSQFSSAEPAGRTSEHLHTSSSAYAETSASSARPKPVTPLSSRTAIRDQLRKIGDQAKERSLSQANIRTVLYDPFRTQSSANAEHDDTSESVKQHSPEIKRTVANPSGLPAHLQLPAARHTSTGPTFSAAVGAPRLTPIGSVENLKQSSPDTYWSKRKDDINDSSEQDQPTPQNFKGPFFGDYPGMPGSSSKEKPPAPATRTYDEELKDWWTNGKTFARQEEFYQRVKESHRDADLLHTMSSSPPSLVPIGTPARKAASSTGLSVGTSDDPMTRLLIPVLENLSSYVQGPVEKRRDYFSQWCQPPDWCIDRSPTGNLSFFDSEWGQPPARVGRDPRYRPMPTPAGGGVESVRFGGFSSPQGPRQGESRLTVGGALDRRFAFGHTVSKQAHSYPQVQWVPNKRLFVGFGIYHCFTTTDPAACKDFRDTVEKLIYIENGHWGELATYVQRVAQDELAILAYLTLLTVVQKLAMKAVIFRRFNRDTHDQEMDSSIGDFADEDNKQWARSKGQYGSGSEPTWAFKSSLKLQAILQTVFPDSGMENSMKNPPNLILPGYEKLWCVFVDNPKLTQIDDVVVGMVSVSAADISQEVLRLHPPTRRVYREYQTSDGKTYQAAADIESSHRDTAAWGSDATLLRPERWDGKFDSKDSQDKVFMPFGAKPFACPAKRRSGRGRLPSGVSMIALLVGVLTAETQGKWKLVGGIPRDGEPSETDREAYGGLRFERIPDEAAVLSGRIDPDELVQ
ncbi:hypothetical protein LTR85_010952 [Meristemomyces frigidus]|nr:hypothetical protein LTR85_010952 [Meristemomyces frigidus]